MEIRHLIQLRNASVIDISEAKLDVPILNIEIVIEDYDLIRLDCSRKGDVLHQTFCCPQLQTQQMSFYGDVSTKVNIIYSRYSK